MVVRDFLPLEGVIERFPWDLVHDEKREPTDRVRHGPNGFTVSLREQYMEKQQKVATFVQEHEMESPPVYRLLDLVSELGEVAKDATESTTYGAEPTDLEISSDELGDVLFSLLALAEAVEINADEALDEALAKYDDRISDSGTASSGD